MHGAERSDQTRGEKIEAEERPPNEQWAQEYGHCEWDGREGQERKENAMGKKVREGWSGGGAERWERGEEDWRRGRKLGQERRAKRRAAMGRRAGQKIGRMLGRSAWQKSVQKHAHKPLLRWQLKSPG